MASKTAERGPLAFLLSWRWWLLCWTGNIVSYIAFGPDQPWYETLLEALMFYAIWMKWENWAREREHGQTDSG